MSELISFRKEGEAPTARQALIEALNVVDDQDTVIIFHHQERK